MKKILRALGILFLAFVALIVVIGVLGGGGEKTTEEPLSVAGVQPTATPKPDETPKPTKTAKPTATPKPTAAPVAPALSVGSSSAYEAGGWYHIIGEIRNDSDNPMEFVKIVATLYDAAGKVVGSAFSYTMLDMVPARDKSPFEIGTDKYAGVSTYKLQVEGRKGTARDHGITIASHSSTTASGWWHVTGEVKNSSSAEREFVKIVATLYDGSGTVIGTSFCYTSLDKVAAGGTSPFECGTDHWAGVMSYAVQVQAR